MGILMGWEGGRMAGGFSLWSVIWPFDMTLPTTDPWQDRPWNLG